MPTETWKDVTVHAERNVMVTMRDGSPLCADVFRPDTDGRVPAIVCMSPYGKDIKWLDHYPDHGIELSPWAVWETPDPGWWSPQGYAVVRGDSRGIGGSVGTLDPLSTTDTHDYYDLIEWAAAQPWCNGKVGLLGISFYAITQWKVAAQRPPHLAAIIPWEGANDLYREWAYQGGIFANGFLDFWWQLHWVNQDVLTASEVVDWREQMLSRPLDDEWYRERSAVAEDVEVPLLSAGNWGAFHIHLRGNTEGYRRAASPHKRLVMMTGTHVDPFYTDWAKAMQLRFFDRWLRELPNGAENDAPVRLAIRHGHEIEWRDEQEWPLARTRYTPYHLDMTARSLGTQTPAEGELSFEAPHGGVVLESAAVQERTEITGPVALQLSLSSTTTDADVFVALHHVARDGTIYHGVGPRGGPVPMAVGWLRASQREVDPDRSTAERPWHHHTRREDLVPGVPVPLQVELWPTSMVLEPGDRLRLEIRSDDVVAGLTHDHPQDRDPARLSGTTVLHSGPGHDSWLLLPIVPADPDRPGDGVRERSVPKMVSRGIRDGEGVHVLLSGGRWTVELDGYGQISRHDSRETAVEAGRTRAARARTWLAIHAEDGTVETVLEDGLR